MPSSARLSAWALQQMRFLTVRVPISIGEKSVGNAAVIWYSLVRGWLCRSRGRASCRSGEPSRTGPARLAGPTFGYCRYVAGLRQQVMVQEVADQFLRQP